MKKKKKIDVIEIGREIRRVEEKEYTEPEQTIPTPAKIKIVPLTQNFGSEEIHVLRDKINEIITCLNS